MSKLTSDQINELAAALAKAQAEITTAVEDKVNPHFKSKYASLNSIWDACRIPLSKNGLAVIQTTELSGDQITLITTLAHSSGQWIKSILPISLVKTTPQALGSALTYMKRYGLAMVAGISSGEDDDANEAQKSAPLQPPKQEIKPMKPEMIVALERNLDKCSPEYTKKVFESLANQGIDDLHQLTPELYQRIFSAASLKAKEFQDLLASEPKEEAMI